MQPIALLILFAALGFAQSLDPDKPGPPAEVDQALRARVKEFYDLHIKGQFRKAEELVAEDTKDLFYNGTKTQFVSCEVSKVDYTDKFTKATALVVCEQYVMMPGAGNMKLKVPRNTTWKVENGKWYWYVDLETLRTTPFGKMTPGPFSSNGTVSPPPSIANMPTNADFLFKQIQLDKPAVSLKPGESAEVTVTNGAPGLMSLAVTAHPVGVQAGLDTAKMPAGEKAVLTISAAKGAKSGAVNLQVEQTLQILTVQVTIVE